MSLFLTWEDLKPEHVERYLEISTLEEITQFLSQLLHLNPEDTNDAILLDFHYYNLAFAVEAKFSPEKISTFFSLMKKTFDLSMSQPHWTWEESFAAFKELLIKHSVQRPPFSVQIFAYEDLSIIAEYALASFFRHYKLYQYSFIPKHVLNLETQSSFRTVTAPPRVEALAKAQPEAEILARNIEWPEEEKEKESLETFHFDAVNADTVTKAIQASLHSQMIELKKTLQAQLDEQERVVSEKLGLGGAPAAAAGGKK
ncbi:putative flagellar associated protein [Paratrimastix pyriformis]|uniref:Flagellar associated protein n=1 Tax=Paratrimastix pyriformis TaxID=342808 RepID=A0ABQ8UPS2_9EUKA|nr:putative flagellar associated protein [Paratrimastix pyriformis]